MAILGLNCCGHDSAVSLVMNDKIVFAMEEERLNRKMHSGDFPERSLRAGLEQAGLSFDDIEHIGFFFKPFNFYSRIPFYALRYGHRIPGLLRERKDWRMETNLGLMNYLGQMREMPAFLARNFAWGNPPKFRFHFLG